LGERPHSSRELGGHVDHPFTVDHQSLRGAALAAAPLETEPEMGVYHRLLPCRG